MATEEREQEIRAEVEQEVVEEAMAYVDGDAENGPREGHGITQAMIDEEVARRVGERLAKERREAERGAIEQAAAEEPALRELLSEGAKWPEPNLRLDWVCSLLDEIGIEASVEQTGGGVATLCVPLPDGISRAEEEYAVMVGPGWFEGPGWTDGRIDLAGGASIGPDDDTGQKPYTIVQADWTERMVASEIERQIRERAERDAAEVAELQALMDKAKAQQLIPLTLSWGEANLVISGLDLLLSAALEAERPAWPDGLGIGQRQGEPNYIADPADVQATIDHIKGA